MVPEFKGNHEGLAAFLKIVKIISDTVKYRSKTIFLDFVINVKLNLVAITALGGSTINSYDLLEQKLTDRFKSKITLAQVQFQLDATIQRQYSCIW